MMRSCDTMVALGDATVHGHVLFAKNSDRPADECQPLIQQERHFHPPSAVVQCRFVQLPQVRQTCRLIGSRPYWCWGYEHGFNEHQVVIGNEGLPSRAEQHGPKLIGMEILRLGLERSRTAADAVEVMTDLITRYGQGKFDSGDVSTYDNGYIVADPHEAYILETAGHEWAEKRVESAVGISNVYSIEADWDRLSPNAEAYACERGWWDRDRGRLSFAAAYTPEARGSGMGTGSRRRARSCAVLRQQAGTIDAPALMALLSDHSDGVDPAEPARPDMTHLNGICMHSSPDPEDTGGNTAASLVADLCGDYSRLPVYWCSFYSPCLGVFLPIFVEGSLPRVLSVGDEHPSDASPWWMFHRLSRVVRRDPERRIPAVRERWARFQSQLLETAYPMAVEGRRLIAQGAMPQAAELLTRYMEENVAHMGQMIGRMLSQFD